MTKNTSFDFTPNKVRVYALGDATDWGDPRRLRYTLDDATMGVLSMSFSADSKLLACGSVDKTVDGKDNSASIFFWKPGFSEQIRQLNEIICFFE